MRNPVRTARYLKSLLALLLALSLNAVAQRQRIHADDYTIDAEIFPATHKLVAKAKVKITALEDTSVAIFELHNALRPTKITDAQGQTLTAERVSQDYSLRIPLNAALNKGDSTVLNFEYEGVLLGSDDSPVEGLKLASISQDFCVLLYAGRWFPVIGYGINRFTATINITVPVSFKVIASGLTAPARVTPGGKLIYNFAWTKPSFPGTLLAGTYIENVVPSGGETFKAYLFPIHKDAVGTMLETAQKEVGFFTDLYGAAPSRVLNVVEIPDDTLPSVWAPEIAGIASRNV